MIIDTHAHSYDEVFVEDLAEVVNRSLDNGVKKVFMPNVDMESIEHMFDLYKRFPGHFYPMMGLHPCYVKADFKEVLKQMETLLKERRSEIFGIGETGLDYYWDTTYVEQQKESLLKHINWSFEYDLPLILHTRNSIPDTIELVKSNYRKGLRGIFHCFSGNLEEAQSILEMEDFYLGIGGTVTYKNSHLPELLKQVSLERLVLETDAPYLPPVPYRGKRNESSYLLLVASKIAENKEVPVEEVARITTQNALKIFKTD